MDVRGFFLSRQSSQRSSLIDDGQIRRWQNERKKYQTSELQKMSRQSKTVENSPKKEEGNRSEGGMERRESKVFWNYKRPVDYVWGRIKFRRFRS